jgi:uncharacterized membrane protein
LKDNHHSTKKGIIKQQDRTVEVQSFDSIIPDPETLAKLEALCPGSTKKWMELAESQIKSNQSQDKVIANTFQISTIGGICAAFLAVTMICSVGCYALYLGHPTAAATIITGSAASVIAAFLIRRASSNSSATKSTVKSSVNKKRVD